MVRYRIICNVCGNHLYLDAESKAKATEHYRKIHKMCGHDVQTVISQKYKQLVAKQAGFALMLELVLVMAIMAILALAAIPSLIHHNNQKVLQTAINSLEWTAMSYKNNAVDNSWSTDFNASTGEVGTYTKVFTKPAGTLTVNAPSKIGGNWTCNFSDASYSVRC